MPPCISQLEGELVQVAIEVEDRAQRSAITSNRLLQSPFYILYIHHIFTVNISWNFFLVILECVMTLLAKSNSHHFVNFLFSFFF